MAQDTTRKIPTNTQAENLKQQIRNRAYELYESRGREESHDVEDWLHAEAEIKKMKEISIAA